MKSRQRTVRFYNWKDWRTNALEGLGGWLGSNVTNGSFLKSAAADAENENNEVWLLAASKSKLWRVSAWIKLRKRLPNELKSNSQYATLVYYDINASLIVGDMRAEKLLEIPEIDNVLRSYGKALEQQGKAGYKFTDDDSKKIFSRMSEVSGTSFVVYAKNSDYESADATQVSLAKPALPNKDKNQEADEHSPLSSDLISVDDSNESSIVTGIEASGDNSEVGQDIFTIQSELESTASELDIQFIGKPGKDIDVIAKSRVGQGPFRTLLIAKHGGRCCISGLDNRELLIASHIVRWSKSDPYQKTDSENGLLLSVSWDSVFDKGFVSFDGQGNLLCSDLLDQETARLLGISTDAKLPPELLTDRRKLNLSWHRENIFRGESGNSNS